MINITEWVLLSRLWVNKINERKSIVNGLSQLLWSVFFLVYNSMGYFLKCPDLDLDPLQNNLIQSLSLFCMYRTSSLSLLFQSLNTLPSTYHTISALVEECVNLNASPISEYISSLQRKSSPKLTYQHTFSTHFSHTKPNKNNTKIQYY